MGLEHGGWSCGCACGLHASAPRGPRRRARARNTLATPQVRARSQTHSAHKCCGASCREAALLSPLQMGFQMHKHTLRNRVLPTPSTLSINVQYNEQTLVCTKLCAQLPSAKWSGNDLIRACSELHGPVPMCRHSVDAPRGHLWQRKRSGQRRRRALRGPHS